MLSTCIADRTQRRCELWCVPRCPQVTLAVLAQFRGSKPASVVALALFRGLKHVTLAAHAKFRGS